MINSFINLSIYFEFYAIGTNSIWFTGLLVYILGIYLGKDRHINFALKYVYNWYHRFTGIQVYLPCEIWLQTFIFEIWYYMIINIFLKKNLRTWDFKCTLMSEDVIFLKVYTWGCEEEEIKSKHIKSWRFTELWVYAVNQRK